MSKEPIFTSDIPVRLIQKMGGDHMVVAAAKVSTTGEDAESFAAAEQSEGNFGLIRYLMSHRHGTPFEHSSLTMFVHAPIFVWREWQRHRIGVSFNEESGRYKQLDPVFWLPRRDRKMIPSATHKSARPDFVRLEDDDMYEAVVTNLKASYKFAYGTYESLLAEGIAKEVARVCLPVATYSSCWVTTNPRALMNFLSLRTAEPKFDPDSKTGAMFPSHPQAEIEEAARVAESFLKEGWPLTYKAFCDSGRVAP